MDFIASQNPLLEMARNAKYQYTVQRYKFANRLDARDVHHNFGW